VREKCDVRRRGRGVWSPSNGEGIGRAHLMRRGPKLFNKIFIT
jgi:hypothetical protein